MRARSWLLVLLVIAASLVIGVFVGVRLGKSHPAELNSGSPEKAAAGTAVVAVRPDVGPTNIYAHNLMLRKGENFRFYVRWLRGQMTRAKHNVNPSFDDPDSFFIDIKTGILRANIGDLTHFMNVSGLKDSPLSDIVITGDGSAVKLKGTLHKIIKFPIQLDGTLSTASGNRVKVHVNKFSALKIPLKGFLGLFKVSLSDLFSAKGIPGVQVVENDILFDTATLLPPPHIRGELTAIRIVNPDLEEVFGNAQQDADRVEEWRNFIRLRDGSLDFGKLTMNHVDLVMVDISKDAWFDLDLSNYQAQLVKGYTRMTPLAGLQIFMPNLSDIPDKKAVSDISIQWMKNRNLPAPADVQPK